MATLSTGTKILSVFGETANTVDADNVFTGPNATGVVDEVLDGSGQRYVVLFNNDVTVKLSDEQLADGLRYQVLE